MRLVRISSARSSAARTCATRLALALAVALAAGANAPASAADAAAWDQAKVIGLAKDFDAAANAWWMALRDEGDDQDFVGSGDSQDYDSMTRESRTLTEAAQGLVGSLSAGKTRAETLDMYKTMKEAMDDLAVDKQRAFLADPTIAAGKKLKATFQALAPYYESK